MDFATKLKNKGFAIDPKGVRNMDDLVSSIVEGLRL